MKKIVAILMVALMTIALLVPAMSVAEVHKYEVKIRTKDMSDGSAVENVEFEVYRKKVKDDKTTYTLVTTGKTNSKGVRSVALEAGSYKVVVKKAPSGYAKADNKWFTVKADKAADITLSMPPVFTLKLTVKDSKGNIVSNALVGLNDDEYEYTDSNGLVTFKNVKYGENWFSISKKVSGKTKVALEQWIELKASPNKTLKKTIQLPEKKYWRDINSMSIPRCN